MTPTPPLTTPWEDYSGCGTGDSWDSERSATPDSEDQGHSFHRPTLPDDDTVGLSVRRDTPTVRNEHGGCPTPPLLYQPRKLYVSSWNKMTPIFYPSGEGRSGENS